MAEDKQISAYIAREVNERLDLYVRETGIKKARVIEDAISEHLDTLEFLPADAIIPTSITLTPESWDRLMERMETPPNPTPALRRLMKGHG
jgi:hypothetical protein